MMLCVATGNDIILRYRDESLKCETVKGTSSFHSVRNGGIPGIIEVKFAFLMNLGSAKMDI